MGKIISFEERSKKFKFEEQVKTVFKEKNSFYEFCMDGDSGVAFLHHNQYVYVFFNYIPRGEKTDLPTLEESFAGKPICPKVSKGEWCVDKIIVMKKRVALKTLPLIYSAQKKEGWLDHFKKEVLKNAKEGESANEK